jgi:hypothetical protein
VNVVKSRRKTDDRAIVDGDDEVMSGIVQELFGTASDQSRTVNECVCSGWLMCTRKLMHHPGGNLARA